MPLPRIRVVPTGSGARAVQVIWHYRDNRPVLDHIGSAHGEEELALLKARAQRLIDDRQPVLSLDDGVGGTGSVEAPLPVVGERAGYLIDAIQSIYRGLGFDTATGDGQVSDRASSYSSMSQHYILRPTSLMDSVSWIFEGTSAGTTDHPRVTL